MLEATGSLTGRCILVVEDEYLIATEIERWLWEAGAKVLGPVPSAEQALELIDAEAGGLDCAVLDINLGEGQFVYPVADLLNELGVPYLFTTGDLRVSDRPAHRERLKLAKPVMERDLLGAIQRLLAS